MKPMIAHALSPNDISALIDFLLKSKDPATVGLRRILKRKKEETGASRLRPALFEEFYVEGKTEMFNKDERAIMELEKKVNDYRIALDHESKELPARLQRARQQGYKEGFAKGEAVAYEKATNEYDLKIDELQNKLRDFCAHVENSKKSMLAHADTLLLAFCCEFAKKIIHAEVSIRPEIILPVLQKALSYIADRERLVIRVAKDDMETVSGRKDFWIPVGEQLESIVIEADERIEKGGCIVESNSGVADARLGVRFDELKEVVFKAWESLGPDGRAGGEPESPGADR
jgi:flagellar biosynthesis/type III secretory pathway protein FliH